MPGELLADHYSQELVNELNYYSDGCTKWIITTPTTTDSGNTIQIPLSDDDRNYWNYLLWSLCMYYYKYHNWESELIITKTPVVHPANM